jgi:2-polyprenyl-3-methyl-5-hydroxy-6-metoxy-1,4-benzoquinol methylase
MNTAGLWDGLWDKAPIAQILYSVEKEEKSAIWSRISQALADRNMGEGCEVVEIGAGSGINSAVFARRGASVTVLDYSHKALQVSAEVFRNLGLHQRSLHADALDLPAGERGRFDVAMSFGLCEHFDGNDRSRIIQSHFDAVRSGGLVVISVPNAHCLPYRFWKWRREMLGKWNFGLELPFSRRELSDIAFKAGAASVEFAGSPFLESFNFILPFARWRRSVLKRLSPARLYDASRLRQQHPSGLDAYLGTALVAIAVKR